MENIILLFLGILLSVIGGVNISGNISTIHSYNRRNVREDDIPKYGKAVGIGTLVIGLSLIIAFIVLFFLSEAVLPFVIGPAVVIGVCFILYGQFKYNHGIF